jgi:hypothetical protein
MTRRDLVVIGDSNPWPPDGIGMLSRNQWASISSLIATALFQDLTCCSLAFASWMVASTKQRMGRINFTCHRELSCFLSLT